MPQPTNTGSTTQGSVDPKPASTKPGTTRASGSGGYGGTQPGSGPITRNLNAYNPRGPQKAPTYIPSEPASSVYPPRDTAETEKTQLTELNKFMEDFNRKKRDATDRYGDERWKAYTKPYESGEN